MATTVIVNNLTIVHEESGGVSVVFPDVCKTPSPGGPVPIPYPNTALSKHTADGSQTVTADGHPFMLKSSSFAQSTGDEPGSAGGVVSGKVKGNAYPRSYSFDVKVEGQNVFRFTDLMLQNGGSPTNTAPGSLMQPNQPGAAAKEAKAKLPEVTSLAWSKAEACCGDLVGLKVETKDAPDQRFIAKVYREGEKPLHDALGADLKGNKGEAKWEVRRGEWKKEVKLAARHRNPGGKQVESGALTVKAPTRSYRSIVNQVRQVPRVVKNARTRAWVADPDPSHLPWTWEVYYEIEIDELKPGRLTITGRIRLLPQGTLKLPGPATLRKWKRSIEHAWNLKWKLHRIGCKRGDHCGCHTRHGCCQFAIRIRCVFDSAPGRGRGVKLFPGACDPHGRGLTDKWWYDDTWWMETKHVARPDMVRAHEFGHLIGLYDEYEEGAIDPSGIYANVPDSIMYEGSNVYDRHMKEFHKWFDQQCKQVIGETELLPWRG